MVNKRFVAVGITIAVVGVLILSNWSFLINKVNTQGDFLTAEILGAFQSSSDEEIEEPFLEIFTGRVLVRVSSEQARALRSAPASFGAEGEGGGSFAKATKLVNPVRTSSEFAIVSDLLKDVESVTPARQTKQGMATMAEGEASPLPAIERWFVLTVGDEQEVVEVTDLESLNSAKPDEIKSNSLAITKEAISRLKASGDFEVVEPSIVIKVADIEIPPNDPYYPDNLWGVERINAESAWEASTGEGVVVAVIDTGVNMEHEDLADNIWTNAGEMGFDADGNDKKSNGIDDDGNGYLDDWRGWDFVYSDNDPSDEHFHGTHVAGTIAAVGNNGEGVVGVAPEAEIMVIRGLNEIGRGPPEQLAEAVHYAADMGAQVANSSWGGIGVSPVLADAFAYAHGDDPVAPNNDVVNIVAAGNSVINIDIISFTPAGLDTTIAVGAIDNSNQRASYPNGRGSNWGNKVDIAAPGKDIESTWIDGSYNAISGTSMATPHVAGVATLIRSIYPEFNNEEVRSILRFSATPLSTDHYIGAGLLDAAEAVVTDYVPPTANLREFDENVFGEIAFFGTVTGGDSTMTRYILDWGVGDNPDSWTEIADVYNSGSVRDGLLSNYDSLNFPEDERNTVRLRVWGVQGGASEDRITIIADNFEILSPMNNDIYRKGDILSINGHIKSSFNSYTISYGEGKHPDSWNLIYSGVGGDSIDGLLANWDTSLLGDNSYWQGDFYTIRLQVDTDYGVRESFVYLIHLDSRLKSGWPKYTLPGLGYKNEQFKLEDLDGNGSKELIVVETNHRSSVANLKVFCIALCSSSDNSLLWEQSIPLRTPLNSPAINAPVRLVPVVADLNGDDNFEIYVSSTAGISSVSVFGFDARSGAPLNDWPVHIQDRVVRFRLSVTDLNNDGKDELLVYSTFHVWLLEDGGDKSFLYRGRFKDFNDSPDRVDMFLATANFDDDSDMEIVVPAGKGRLDVINGDGSIISNWTSHQLTRDRLSSFGDSVSIGDMNNDGKNEIVVIVADEGDTKLIVIDNEGEILSTWTPPSGRISRGKAVSLADINNDKKLEIIVVSDNFASFVGEIFLLDLFGQGGVVSGWPKKTSLYATLTGVVVDINGDGQSDIVTKTGGLNSRHFNEVNQKPDICTGGICAWEYDGSPINLSSSPNSNYFNIYTEGGINRTGSETTDIVIDDIDNDGLIEIISSSLFDVDLGRKYTFKNRGSVYIWDIDVPFRPSSSFWPRYLRDNQHTSRYIEPPSPPLLKWQNPNNRFDVNDSGFVTPIDINVLVRAINSSIDLSSLPSTAQPPPYYDVNGDDRLIPLDVLDIVNYVNREGAGG